MTWHTETIEVINRDQRRRRWSAAEKAIVVCILIQPASCLNRSSEQYLISSRHSEVRLVCSPGCRRSKTIVYPTDDPSPKWLPLSKLGAPCTRTILCWLIP